MSMRRTMQAAICVIVVWVTMFELGGWAVYKGEAAVEATAVELTAAAPAAPITITHTEKQPLLAKPAAYESADDVEIEQAVGKQEPDVQTKQAAIASEPVVPAPTKPSGKTVYLTFDDGPSQHTEQVLDILQAEGIKATFFMLGEQVEQQPDIARRVLAEGHAIGNHSYNHKYEKLYGSFAVFAEQVMKADDAIFAATGVRTPLFRAPGGTYSNFDQGYFDAMAAAGYIVHDWNVDSGDSKRRGVPSSEIIATVKGSKLADSLNVLLHDGGGHEESVKALPAIIAYYKEKGYSFAPITTAVTPIHFSLAKKLKWSRPAVKESEKAALVLYAEQLSRDRMTLPQPVHAEPNLILHRGEEQLVLSPEEYSLSKGSIKVSLAKLTEWIGGTAELDPDSGVVEAYYNGERIYWLTDFALGGAKGRDEAAIVPVRSTLQKFGLAIESYVYNAERREIWVR